jgi:hypothetical protein
MVNKTKITIKFPEIHIMHWPYLTAAYPSIVKPGVIVVLTSQQYRGLIP